MDANDNGRRVRSCYRDICGNEIMGGRCADYSMKRRIPTALPDNEYRQYLEWCEEQDRENKAYMEFINGYERHATLMENTRRSSSVYGGTF